MRERSLYKATRIVCVGLFFWAKLQMLSVIVEGKEEYFTNGMGWEGEQEQRKGGEREGNL